MARFVRIVGGVAAVGATGPANPVIIGGIDSGTGFVSRLELTSTGFVPVTYDMGTGLADAEAATSFAPIVDFNGSYRGLNTTTHIFNGSTWDRLRSVEAGAGLTTGLLAQGAYEYDGTNWEPKAQVIATDNTNLSGVVVTGAGTGIDTFGSHPYSLITVASSVTTGGSMTIEGSPDDSNWVTLATRAVGGNGTFVDTVDIPIRYIRANLATRTDGTYTAYLQVPPSGADAWL